MRGKSFPGALWAMAGSIGVTVVVLTWPSAPFGVRHVVLHAVIETISGGVAVLAAGVAVGRLRIERSARDLALGIAFTVFAVTNLLFSLPHTLFGGATMAVLDAWATLTARLVATAVFCVAAFVPAVEADRRTQRRAWVGTALACLTIGAFPVLLADRLPAAAGTQELAAPLSAATLGEFPLLVGAQALQVGLAGAAFVGFRRRARREGDRAADLLATAAVYATFSRLHHLLHPSLQPDVVYTGDLLRLCFYAAVLLAVWRELRERYRQAAELAALEERRRLARDLHDGLAQELAFITTRAWSLARTPGAPEGVLELVSASERALDESRRAITALVQPTALPLPALLGQVAEEVAARHGAPLRLDLPDDDVELTDEQREMLVRVTREALTNAARHAGAQEIVVSLTYSTGVKVSVHDDGAGFDPEDTMDPGPRYGLMSMRERAEALGAAFAIRSAPGAGTMVEVRLP